MTIGQDETVRVALRGAARSVMRERGDEVLVEGAAGTGKSFAALYKIHLMCLANPGMRALIVRKTGRSLAATGLVTFREQVAAHAIKARLLKWYGGSGEKPAQYIYGNGSVIVVGGMDNADKIMSSEYDVVFAQEATELTPDDVEKINTRLRNGVVSFQQLIMDCNPQQPSHWLNRRCQEGRTVRLQSRHEDNPRLFTDAGQVTEYGAAYIRKLDNLTGVRKLRLRDGKWAAAEGIIYAGWNPAVHLSDRKNLPREWTRIWAVDFGFRHPFVWQMWAVDGDGALWLEREIHMTERLVEDHARDIMRATRKAPRLLRDGRDAGPLSWPTGSEGLRALEWKYPKPRVILCDHDAEDRATLERHLGMGTVPAWKSISDGIQACQARMKVAGNGRPGMRVLRDSLVEVDVAAREAGQPTCFAEEVEGYVWKPRPQAVAGREKPEPDEPEKIGDDSMDAFRYATAYQDLQPAPRVRWL